MKYPCHDGQSNRQFRVAADTSVLAILRVPPGCADTAWLVIPNHLYNRDGRVALRLQNTGGSDVSLAGLAVFEDEGARATGGGQSSVRTDQKTTGYLHCRPNPFTRATNVAFQILEPSDVTLAVYDISGKRVRTLVTGHASCGFREVAWNGKDDSGSPVPAGTYFCRLWTSGHSRIEAVRLLE